MPAPSATASPPTLSHRAGLFLMALSTVFFAASVLLIRAVGDDRSVDVWLISSVRFSVGLGLCFLCYRRDFRPRQIVRSRLLLERGLLGGASVAAYYVALLHIGAGRATFINCTYPIWGGLLAVWALREPLQGALLVGAGAALAGLGLLTHTFGLAPAAPGWFDVVAFATALASGWIVVTIRKLHAYEHTATIFGSQCAYGLAVCLGPTLWHLAAPSATALALMLAAGLLAGFGQLTMTHAYRSLRVAEGSLLQMLVPIGIAAGGMVCFGERFRPAEAAGAGLILAGTVLPLWQRRRTAPPSARPLRIPAASAESSG